MDILPLNTISPGMVNPGNLVNAYSWYRLTLNNFIFLIFLEWLVDQSNQCLIYFLIKYTVSNCLRRFGPRPIVSRLLSA